MTGREWVGRVAAALGVDALRDIAGVAAHASERTAAPIACWLIGRAGADVDEARRLADEVG